MELDSSMAHNQTRIDECLASIAEHKNALHKLKVQLAELRMLPAARHALAAMAAHDNASYTLGAYWKGLLAARRTFDIAEMREPILEHLPPKDLLLAQRVSKDWQATITTSKKLKFHEKLFFRPISSQILKHNGHPKGKWLDVATNQEVIPIWNPLLVPIYKALRKPEMTTFYDRLHQTWRRPEASWRKMLRSQPPTKGIAHVRCQRPLSEEEERRLEDYWRNWFRSQYPFKGIFYPLGPGQGAWS